MFRASQRCTLTFETLSVWSRAADGTDVNACAASGSVLVAGDDFGRVRAYRYPATQPLAGSVEMLGHSAHVTDVAFLAGGARSARKYAQPTSLACI